MRLVFSQDNDHPNETTSEEEIFRTSIPLDTHAANAGSRVLAISGHLSGGSGAKRIRLYSQSSGVVFDTDASLDDQNGDWLLTVTSRINQPSLISFTSGDFYHADVIGNIQVPYPSDSSSTGPIYITVECEEVGAINVSKAQWFVVENGLNI